MEREKIQVTLISSNKSKDYYIEWFNLHTKLNGLFTWEFMGASTIGPGDTYCNVPCCVGGSVSYLNSSDFSCTVTKCESSSERSVVA